MKLDVEVMRDLLFELEDNLNLGDKLILSNSPIYSELDSQDKIYAAIKLYEAGYINATVDKFLDMTYRVIISDLTWDGHQFLDNIRPKQSWEKAKELAKNVGSVSVQILSEVAKKVASDFINQQIRG